MSRTLRRFSFLTALKREQTLQIVTLKDAGHTWTEIFCLLNDAVPISVMRYLYNRHKSDGILNERPGRGRKKSLSSRQERQVIRQVLDNRRMTLAQIKQYVTSQFNIVISRPSISGVLKKAGIKSYVPVKKPQLTKQQRFKRIQWAKAHRHWKKEDWRKVIFSDESIFRMHSCRRTQKVWRRSHERFNPKCMNFSVKHPLSVQA